MSVTKMECQDKTIGPIAMIEIEDPTAPTTSTCSRTYALHSSQSHFFSQWTNFSCKNPSIAVDIVIAIKLKIYVIHFKKY
jgi:hypothetical protein